MLADIRSDHRSHAELAGCEITCQAADIERRDYSGQCVRALPQSPVLLSQKSRDDSCQRVARTRRAQACVASWISEYAPIGRSVHGAAITGVCEIVLHAVMAPPTSMVARSMLPSLVDAQR